jgi:hypothetical protein
MRTHKLMLLMLSAPCMVMMQAYLDAVCPCRVLHLPRSQPPFLFGGSTGGAADAATRMRLLGSAAGLTAAVLSAFSFLAIRKLGAAEKAPVVAMVRGLLPC